MLETKQQKTFSWGLQQDVFWNCFCVLAFVCRENYCFVDSKLERQYKPTEKQTFLAPWSNHSKLLGKINVFVTSLQRVSRESPKSFQRVSRESPESLQRICIEPPGSLQRVSREFPESLQRISKESPESLQRVSRRLCRESPESCQRVSKKPPENCSDSRKSPIIP